jgi:VWFA-related protein
MKSRNSRPDRRWPTVFAFAVWTLLGGAGSAPAQEPRTAADAGQLTFAIRSQLVQVHLTVKDGSNHVSGLTLSDFDLSEDGVRRDIDRLDSGTMPLQVALLFDTSESMRGALRQIQEAATYFVESLQPGDRITLVTFNSDIRSIVQAGEDFKPILDGIQQAQPRGITKLYDALLFAMKHLSEKEGRKAIVLFTDGEDTAFGSSLDVALRAAAFYGYPIYTLSAGEGLKSQALRNVLRRLADANGARMFLVQNPSELRPAFLAVSGELRSTYVLNYYTAAPRDGRWHALDVKARDPRLKVRARKGFFARSGGSQTVLSMPADPMGARPPALWDAPRRERGEAGRGALAATQEIRNTPVPAVPLVAPPRPVSLPYGGAKTEQAKPLFKVESRFVEVPVVVESLDGKEPALLEPGDFRLYEDEFLREIVFFRKNVSVGDMDAVRKAALETANERGAGGTLSTSLEDVRQMVLARYYLVFDDLMTEISDFMYSKKAAANILREYYSPVRPVSLHFTSQPEASALADEDLETMLHRLEDAAPRANHEVTKDSGMMTVYQAYLIERGNAEAEQVAELRFAFDNYLDYTNSMGNVEGLERGSPDMIRANVHNISRELVVQNFSYVARALGGLRAVVNAAAADPGTYPKTIIFVSSGFVLGKGSMRGDTGPMMDAVIAAAKRKGVRVFTLDAAGLKVPQTFTVEAQASFLVGNPHLESVFGNYANNWMLDKESSLNQLASETGGRFIHNTNDLVSSAGLVLRTTGQLYYLGYMSAQPADGRFHKIRITTPRPAVRLHARQGYVASLHPAPASGPSETGASGNWDTTLAEARIAEQAGDTGLFAKKLELLTEGFPQEMPYWYNLGIARLRLDRVDQAVQALQRAFLLAPEERPVGMALSHALVRAGLHEAAEATLRRMMRTHDGDIALTLQLGRVYEASGLDREAYNVYRRVLDQSSSPPLDAYLLLIRTSKRIGRELEAEVLVEDYLAHGGTRDQLREWNRQ